MAKDFAAIYNDEPAPWKIPTEELTTKDLLVQNDSGRSVLERVMEGNEWHKLAPGVVTEACLLLPVSGSGETMAHYIADNAAGYGCEEIPPQVREATTARVLMKTDMEGARNGRGPGGCRPVCRERMAGEPEGRSQGCDGVCTGPERPWWE